MKLYELIAKLDCYNKDAELKVIVHNQPYNFSIVWGGTEGVSKENTDEVGFYVDELCNNEQEEK